MKGSVCPSTLTTVMGREYVLKNAIDSMKKNYDSILIACMPSLGMMTVNALVAADRVMIVSLQQKTDFQKKGVEFTWKICYDRVVSIWA